MALQDMTLLERVYDAVKFYEGPHYMFSNFSAFAVKYKGASYMTAEHAYQAAKFPESWDLQSAVVDAPSAHLAKKVAHQYDDVKRPDWDEAKLGVMEEILRAKLEQHPYVQRKLLETEDRLIVEDSPTDSFWGRGPDWRGENHLGKLWMKLRHELRAKAAA